MAQRILFLSRFYYPHVGGVEKQVYELSRRLVKGGHQVTVVTTKHDPGLADREVQDGIKIVRIPVINIKYFGLIFIWLWLLKHINLIRQADIIHAHSVLIWYWPFRLLFPRKPIYVTFHGWEGIYPIPLKNILIRKVDAIIAWKNITISDYIVRHYGIKADVLMYTSVDAPRQKNFIKDYKRLVYVGRLDEDTGISNILRALSYLKGFKVDFCGDGPLANECQQYGSVHGFVDPNPFLAKAFICLSPGHTSILEAFTHKCLVVTTYNNPVKKDYLLMTPFADWIVVSKSPKKIAAAINYYSNHPIQAQQKINSAYNWVLTQNWTAATKIYLQLWNLN